MGLLIIEERLVRYCHFQRYWHPRTMTYHYADASPGTGEPLRANHVQRETFTVASYACSKKRPHKYALVDYYVVKCADERITWKDVQLRQMIAGEISRTHHRRDGSSPQVATDVARDHI